MWSRKCTLVGTNGALTRKNKGSVSLQLCANANSNQMQKLITSAVHSQAHIMLSIGLCLIHKHITCVSLMLNQSKKDSCKKDIKYCLARWQKVHFNAAYKREIRLNATRCIQCLLCRQGEIQMPLDCVFNKELKDSLRSSRFINRWDETNKADSQLWCCPILQPTDNDVLFAFSHQFQPQFCKSLSLMPL